MGFGTIEMNLVCEPENVFLKLIILSINLKQKCGIFIPIYREAKNEQDLRMIVRNSGPFYEKEYFSVH